MISVKEFADRFGISERTVRNYCAIGKIEGAVLVGKTWSVPEDAILPVKQGKIKCSPLLAVFREQKEMQLNQRHEDLQRKYQEADALRENLENQSAILEMSISFPFVS